jgi:hypothetical protein
MCQGFVSIGIPRHLTIRSSRPRVVASAMCFTLRLHMSAAPTQGGLTQALGGSNPYTVHCDLLARRSGHFRPAAVFNRCACCCQCLCIASASSQCALIYLVRYACLLRQRCLPFGGVVGSRRSASEAAGGKLTGRAQASRLRFFGKGVGVRFAPASTAA